LNKKEVLIGIFSGFFANFIGIILIALILFQDFDVVKIVSNSIYENNFTKLLSLGAIMNLLVFFIFLKLNFLERARGVVITTFIIAVLTIYLNNF
tara:strand:- start:1279 stop:1563 length:285 start_codon:yes stop_codon:yes gene_type:complete